MITRLILLPAILLSTTGCMNTLIDRSTNSINANSYAIQRSTEVINENAALIEQSNKVIAENQRLLEKLGEH